MKCFFLSTFSLLNYVIPQFLIPAIFDLRKNPRPPNCLFFHWPATPSSFSQEPTRLSGSPRCVKHTRQSTSITTTCTWKSLFHRSNCLGSKLCSIWPPTSTTTKKIINARNKQDSRESRIETVTNQLNTTLLVTSPPSRASSWLQSTCLSS
jgi:hypothetical protein